MEIDTYIHVSRRVLMRVVCVCVCVCVCVFSEALRSSDLTYRVI